MGGGRETQLSDRWLAVVFVLCGAVALNSSYMAHMVLRLSRYVPVVIVPLALGLMVSRVFEGPRMIVFTVLAMLLVASVLTSITVLTPVIFGVFQERSYANWFTFLILYRVFGNILFTAFHMIVSALAGIFIWGRW